MATDLRGYTEQEVLNKVLNTSNDSIQVDIVSGSEYAEDSSHTDADTGQFILGVRNDTLAALGGTDGDYVPFQMSADGALYVEIATGGSASAVYADDADWTDGSSKHMLVGGLYQSSPQSITDGDVGPLQVNSNGNLIIDVVNGGVLESAVDGIETLLTGIDADTDAIKTAVGIIDNAVHVDDAGFTLGTHSGMMMMGFAGPQSVNSNDAAALACTTAGALHVNILAQTSDLTIADGGNSITVDGTVTANLSATDNAVLDTIDATLDKMLYGTALAVNISGGDHSLGATYEAFYIGVGGDISLDMATSGANIVFKNVASGQILPLQATVVNQTGTTATDIVALKA